MGFQTNWMKDIQIIIGFQLWLSSLSTYMKYEYILNITTTKTLLHIPFFRFPANSTVSSHYGNTYGYIHRIMTRKVINSKSILSRQGASICFRKNLHTHNHIMCHRQTKNFFRQQNSNLIEICRKRKRQAMCFVHKSSFFFKAEKET